MENKLVSIITPSYNSEEFVNKYFTSILSQTYKNLEVIYVNDGSTDKTEKLAKRYEIELKNKGIKFIYIKKKNGGVSSAINAGLKKFTGEYLVFPDADDFYDPTAIDKMVDFLNKNKDYGLVRVNAKFVDRCNKVLGYFYNKNNRFREYIFEDLIFAKDIYYQGYMFRASFFLNELPNRTIYDSRAGQNYQLLLPMTYKYKCGYIDEPLYNYLVRENSLSHTNESLEQRLKRTNDRRDILMEVLASLGVKEKYSKRICINKIRSDFRSYAIFGDKYNAKKNYLLLKKEKENNNLDRVIYYMLKINIFNKCLLVYQKLLGRSII